ncbi:flavin reductase family protein [bacterium]|nr:flavin reductase family protein [bacterium]
MSDYMEVELGQAYRLINPGPLVLVSTVSKAGQYNIAPIAWSCPVEKDPANILVAIGKSHQTFKNIQETKKIIVCIPHASQLEIVKNTGKVSGEDIDKFEKFGIENITGKKSDCKIPTGVIGYIECNVINIVDTEDVGLVIGEAVYAAADSNAFTDRLLSETKAGKTLHHLGSNKFYIPTDEILN